MRLRDKLLDMFTKGPDRWVPFSLLYQLAYKKNVKKTTLRNALQKLTKEGYLNVCVGDENELFFKINRKQILIDDCHTQLDLPLKRQHSGRMHHTV